MNDIAAQIPFDLVVFDLDGTLVDTGADLTASLNHALGRMGRQSVTEAAVRDMVGHGARKLLERGLSATGECNEALIEAGFDDFMQYYAAHICDHSRAFAGVEAALDALSAAGRRVAICTNKPEGLARQLVSAIGWDGRFAAILGGDSIDVRKPDPRHLTATIAAAGGGRTAYVGDSTIDVEAARAAGIPVIAVSFGFAVRPPAELGADILIDHYDKLLSALNSL